jgi:hypothetical protein
MRSLLHRKTESSVFEMTRLWYRYLRLWDGNGTARILLYRMRAEGRCDSEPICETHLALRRH